MTLEKNPHPNAILSRMRRAVTAESMQMRQGVALTGCNITGPPSRAALWWVTLRRPGVLETTTDDDDRLQTPTSKTILALYAMCRRASNNWHCLPQVYENNGT